MVRGTRVISRLRALIPRVLAVLILATHVAAGLLPAAFPAFAGVDLAPKRDDPRPSDDGPAFHLDRRAETVQAAGLLRSPDRLPSLLRRAAALLPAAEPPAPSRLDYCREFTKPDYLKLRLSATPQSYRSPPA